MVSILRVFPNQLVATSLKFLIGCRYISKIENVNFFSGHENKCKQIKKEKDISIFKKNYHHSYFCYTFKILF